MQNFQAVSVLAIAVAAGWAMPAQAQDDSAAVQRELAAMRAQMAAMASRIDTLEAQLADAKARAVSAAQAAEAATETAQGATQVASAAQAAAAKAPKVEVAWKGAPEIRGEGGWSFKPRGRLQVDMGSVNGPSGLTAAQKDHLGTSIELRRAYLGFDGTIPGGFGYRAEIDVAASSVALTDLYLTYKASKDVTWCWATRSPTGGWRR